jgi:outer membrane receptor for ferrienterochelin and colicin
MTIKGLKLAANAKYEYGNIFTVEGAIAYHNQNKEHGFFNGYDRPRWIIDAGVTMNPIDNLSVNLNYQYRGVRTIYEDGSEYVPLVMDYVGHRLPDLTLLGVGAKWQPITNLAIWGEVNNILGCKGAILPSQFQEGVNFAVGFGVTF